MYQILNEDTPVFDRYYGDANPEFTHYRSMYLPPLLSTIAADRAVIIELITNLTNGQLSRIGVHPKYGRLTILKWGEFFVLHEAHHLFTVFQLVSSTE